MGQRETEREREDWERRLRSGATKGWQNTPKRPQISMSGNKEHYLALILPLLSRKEVDRCLGIVKAPMFCSFFLFGRVRRILFWVWRAVSVSDRGHRSRIH